MMHPVFTSLTNTAAAIAEMLVARRMKIRKAPTPRNGSLFPNHYDYDRPGKFSNLFQIKRE